MFVTVGGCKGNKKGHPPVDRQMTFMKLYSVVVVVPKMGTAKSRCDFDFSRSQNDPDYFSVKNIIPATLVVLKMGTTTLWE